MNIKKIKGVIFCLPVILGCCMATNTYAKKVRSFSGIIAWQQRIKTNKENLQKYWDSDMSNKINTAVGARGPYLEKIYELFADSSQHRDVYICHRADWFRDEQTLQLDMHGYNVVEAKRILHDLIDSIIQYNRTAIRKVSLLTGVGNNNETHEPLLTNALIREAARVCPYATNPNNPGIIHLYPFGYNRQNRNT